MSIMNLHDHEWKTCIKCSAEFGIILNNLTILEKKKNNATYVSPHPHTKRMLKNKCKPVHSQPNSKYISPSTRDLIFIPWMSSEGSDELMGETSKFPKS